MGFNHQGENSIEKLLEKEKILVTSIFSYFHKVSQQLMEKYSELSNFSFVICKYFQFGKSKIILCGTGLTLSQTSASFYMPAVQVF